MNLWTAFRSIEVTPRQALKITAALTFANGTALALFLLKIEKTVGITETRFNYLADIVSRNLDELEDFDIIALTELGMLRQID